MLPKENTNSVRMFYEAYMLCYLPVEDNRKTKLFPKCLFYYIKGEVILFTDHPEQANSRRVQSRKQNTWVDETFSFDFLV